MLFRGSPTKYISSSSHPPSLAIVSIVDTFLSLPHSRKRRLSESNPNEPAAKKYRGSGWSPKKQMVSNLLPLPTKLSNWESWCTEVSVLPPSATINHPVPDALDFDLYNFGAFPVSKYTGQFEIHNASSRGNYLPTLSDIADPSEDIRSEFPEQQDAWVAWLCVTPCQTGKDL